MIRNDDLTYQMPPGCHDEHFLYVYDAAAAGLTPGTDNLNLSIYINHDADFVLRKIDGWGTVLAGVLGPPFGSLWLRNAERHVVSDAPWSWGQPQQAPGSNQSFAVLPERTYPAGSVIDFDIRRYSPALFVQSSSPNRAVPASQLVFYGVKRFHAPPPAVLGDYTLRSFAYRLPVTFDWGLTKVGPLYLDPNSPQQRYKQIRDYDFELWGIRACDITPTSRTLPTPQCRWNLYDANGHARSNVPVLAPLQTYENGVSSMGLPVPYTMGSAIVPPIVYPVGSQIKLDLWSMYLLNDPLFPYRVELTFFGAQRIPR